MIGVITSSSLTSTATPYGESIASKYRSIRACNESNLCLSKNQARKILDVSVSLKEQEEER